MIVEFSVVNFRSIRERQTLSFEATSQTDYPDNIFEANGYRLLKSIGIYGANSSGKSNIVLGLGEMLQIIDMSFQLSSADYIKVEPFLLNKKSATEPTSFEISFIINEKNYRYGFSITREKVHAEYLYQKKSASTKEYLLFARENDIIEVGEHFQEGLGIEKRTKENSLFLTVVDQFNGEVAGEIMDWCRKYTVFSGLEHKQHGNFTKIWLASNSVNMDLIQFINSLNLGFKKISLSEDEGIQNQRVLTSHQVFDNNGMEVNKIDFDLIKQESSGTNKIFDIAGQIVASLTYGWPLAIDELDAKLHTLLTQTIIQLFLNNATNPNNSQLLFTTHDTNLLSADILRRDQIYFTEKNEREETCLYSLVEFKPRKDTKLEKNYIQGRFGAIPYLGDFSKLIKDGKVGEDK